MVDAATSAISGTNWIALAPVPTTASRRAGQVEVVVPLGGVEHGPLEVADPGQRRDRGPGELAAGGDQQIELGTLARVGDHGPASALGVEAGLGHLGAEPQVGCDAEVARALFEVGEDLPLRCVTARPVVPGRERERVQVRGHVAGGARVGVRAPDPADGVAPLEYGQLLEPGLAQPDRRADAAEAGADDPGGETAPRAVAPAHASDPTAAANLVRRTRLGGGGWEPRL